MCDQARVSPEGTRKLHEKVSQMPMVPTPAILSFFPQDAPRGLWSVLYDRLTEEEKTEA